MHSFRITITGVTELSALVVHRALNAMHRGDRAQLARQLHADVVYDTGRELISGRELVAASMSAPEFKQLRAEIVPGRVEDRGDHLTAQLLTILRWRGSDEPVDLQSQMLAIHVHEGLITRVESLPVPASER